jgi:hypothetical protein
MPTFNRLFYVKKKKIFFFEFNYSLDLILVLNKNVLLNIQTKFMKLV